MTVASGQDVVGLVFFEILFMAFAAMFAQIFTFPLEYDMMDQVKVATSLC